MPSNLPRLSERHDTQFEALLPTPGIPNADYSYAPAGSLAVQFTDMSTDDDGTIVAWEWEFDDDVQRPVSEFSFVVNGQAVQFTDASVPVLPATIASWLWNFGDGSTSTSQNPSHNYAVGGQYSVTLTATDSGGNASISPAQHTVFIGTGTGKPFGPMNAWSGYSSPYPATSVFSSDISYIRAGGIFTRMAKARELNKKLLFSMSGGNHNNYITNAAFDINKWYARMDEYDTPSIRAAVAQFIADGFCVGNTMVDEPDHGTWGGVFTKAMLNTMALYVHAIFPTLPTGQLAQVTWRGSEKWGNETDFNLYQYSARRGSITEYRDSCLSNAANVNSGQPPIKTVFSFNLLNGGSRLGNEVDGWCPIGPDLTGGLGTSSAPPNCRVTANQILAFTQVLGAAGAAMYMWEYELDMMTRPDNVVKFAAAQAFMDAQLTIGLGR